MTGVDKKVRQKTLRMLSNGVSVLTSRSDDRDGVATVTWVSQVSFKPPLIMAAVRRESNVFKCLAASGTAVLHIVGNEQEDFPRRIGYGKWTHPIAACGLHHAKDHHCMIAFGIEDALNTAFNVRWKIR